MNTATAPVIKWADPRLQQAYLLIEEAMYQQHPEMDAHGLLKTALGAIEDADCEIERVNGPTQPTPSV